MIPFYINIRQYLVIEVKKSLIFWTIGDVLYLDLGGVYMGIFTMQRDFIDLYT